MCILRLVENDVEEGVELFSQILALAHAVVGRVGDEPKPNVVQLFQSFQKLRKFGRDLRNPMSPIHHFMTTGSKS